MYTILTEVLEYAVKFKAHMYNRHANKSMIDTDNIYGLTLIQIYHISIKIYLYISFTIASSWTTTRSGISESKVSTQSNAGYLTLSSWYAYFMHKQKMVIVFTRLNILCTFITHWPTVMCRYFVLVMEIGIIHFHIFCWQSSMIFAFNNGCYMHENVVLITLWFYERRSHFFI